LVYAVGRGEILLAEARYSEAIRRYPIDALPVSGDLVVLKLLEKFNFSLIKDSP